MRLLTALSLLIGAMVITACATPLKETNFIAEKPAFRLAIAADRSEFKDSLRAKLVETYKGRAQIELIPLRKVNIKDHDVVLIMDTCMAWTMFNPSLKAFLRKSKDRDKVILFITAANKDWNYSYRGVDAITSASVAEQEDAVLATLTEQIDRIVENPPAN
jgi:hypothetical protein